MLFFVWLLCNLSKFIKMIRQYNKMQCSQLSSEYTFACVCMCVCLCPSTAKASSVWNSWDCQGTDQRCCVEDVGFLCRFPSSLLWNAEHNLSASCFILFVHQKRAQPRLNQYASRFQNIGPSFTINRRRLRYALHREPICFCISTHERVRNLSRKC